MSDIVGSFELKVQSPSLSTMFTMHSIPCTQLSSNERAVRYC